MFEKRTAFHGWIMQAACNTVSVLKSMNIMSIQCQICEHIRSKLTAFNGYRQSTLYDVLLSRSRSMYDVPSNPKLPIPFEAKPYKILFVSSLCTICGFCSSIPFIKCTSFCSLCTVKSTRVHIRDCKVCG